METCNSYLVVILCAMSSWSHSFAIDFTITSKSGRVRGIQNTQDSDFVLGGLFAVHSRNLSQGVGSESCGQIRCQEGIERVEAMLFAIDQINNDPHLLPNLTLGYDIRDTCYEEHVGLDEAADLILSGTHLELNNKNQCNNSISKQLQVGTIGLIGAGASRVSIPIAGLTRLFEIPQISYSSTSAILSDRERYSYFFRTIPSDTKETMAIVDTIRYFNWTFISTVFTRDSYGQSGIDDLHDLASKHGICIDISEGIEVDFKDDDYDNLAAKISKSEAKVIVLYASQEAAQKLLSKETIKNFTWIATSAWVQSVNTLVGVIGIVPKIRTISEFNDYFTMLRMNRSNNRNPWFSEYIKCNDTVDPEPLSQEQEGYSTPLVIDAAYTFAHALNEYLIDNCDQPLIWIHENQTCIGLKQQLTGSVLLDYIRNTSFLSPTGKTVYFDSEGGVEALYDIVNYQQIEQDVVMITIGTWNSMNYNNTNFLHINNSVGIHFGVGKAGKAILQSTESHCGICKPGEYLRNVPSSCCGLCEPCLGQNFSNASFSIQCSNCSTFGDMWGNNPTSGSSSCIPIPQKYLGFSSPLSILIMITSIIGLILLSCMVVIIGMNWTTPIIRASGRESMVVIVIGTAISFIVAFIYVAPPSLGICTLQRICLWLGFGLIFSSLTVKVIRIARIFVFQKSSFKHLKCMNIHHIILQTTLLFVVQVVIVFISLLIRFPAVVRHLRLDPHDHNILPEIVITCAADHEVGLVVSIVYETGLVVTSTVLATLTFKSPANFNEAKSICCAAFGLLVVWIAFFPTSFALQQKQELQNVVIAGTVNLTAYVILVCLFGPRLFIVLFWKEKNTIMHSRRPSSEGVLGQRETGLRTNYLHTLSTNNLSQSNCDQLYI